MKRPMSGNTAQNLRLNDEESKEARALTPPRSSKNKHLSLPAMSPSSKGGLTLSSTEAAKIKNSMISSPITKSSKHLQSDSESVKEGPPTDEPTSLRSTFKTKIVGDIFGTSTNGLDGLMYRSRVMAKLEQQKKTTKLEEVIEQDKTESVVSTVDYNQSDSDTDDEFRQFKSMNPKQQLALTMKNWTLSEDNDEHIISEGGVQALIALCHVEDAAIRKCCASSFYNLSNRVQNREKLLNSGATNGVVLCLHGSPPRCSW